MKLITIAAPATEVTIQELVNAIREWQDNPEAIDDDDFIVASGKDGLGGGIKVGITLKLINNWRIQFEARSGPDYVPCRISGGNLVAVNDYNNNPIKPTAFTQVIIAQSASTTISEEIFSEVDEVRALLENRLEVDEFASQLKLYDDQGITIIKVWNLIDRFGKPIQLQGTGPISRGKVQKL